MTRKVAKPKEAKPKASPSRTVNIFDVLKQISNHMDDYYERMPETDQKQLHPLVLTRWLSGVTDPVAILLLNSTVNKYNFSLAKHKPLLMQMLLIASNGLDRRFKWMPRGSSANANGKRVQVLREYYKCSTREAEMYMKHHTVEEMCEMADYLGWQKEDTKQLSK